MNARTATIAALLLCSAPGLAACDFALYPETSDYAGSTPPIAALEAKATAMPDRDDVVTVEVDIADVVLHRASDDAWVLMSSAAHSVDLVARDADFKPVPLEPEVYDRIAFGVEALRVGSEAGWVEAAVEQLEVEVEGEFVVEGDVVVQLAFDVERGLTGDAASGFHFQPIVDATIAKR